MSGEKIISLFAGDEIPEGWTIVRILATEQVQDGVGANFKIVYTISIRKLTPAEVYNRNWYYFSPQPASAPTPPWPPLPATCY